MDSPTTHAGRKGFWISIDGADGVGKTTLARHLAATIDESVLTPEFSDSPVGKFLRNAVQTNPHFISESLIEQSLLFLADFFRIYDSAVRPSVLSGKLAISDRGYVSKYVYQLIVLSSGYDSRAVRVMLDSLFSLISPPDLTLLLTCEENMLVQRLLHRDGHCDKDRIDFIEKANKEMMAYLVSHNCRFARIDQHREMAKSYSLSKGETAVRAFLDDIR
jgi:dTMP kinase